MIDHSEKTLTHLQIKNTRAPGYEDVFYPKRKRQYQIYEKEKADSSKSGIDKEHAKF